jgi:hypothetical protein
MTKDSIHRDNERAVTEIRTNFDMLTQREREVLDLVLAGRGDKQIAAGDGEGAPRTRDAKDEDAIADRTGQDGGQAEACLIKTLGLGARGRQPMAFRDPAALSHRSP